MTTYLERYLAGERERVWAELLALGARVRDEPVYSDALAVARETMRRARHNIEVLIPRLEEIGYYFGYGWLENDERSFANWQPPVFGPPKPHVLDRIIELETLIGPLPLSLRAWYETVGAVNFVGAAPEQWHVDERADPLYIYPIEEALAEYAEWKTVHTAWAAGDEANDPGPFRVPIAPDFCHKYNISGGMWYHIVLPNPAMDAPLQAERHAVTFVKYLRICFHWGGLPGLDIAPVVPAPELASLTRDLLPL
ncbi:MAG: hypothetical protein OJF49_003531 [Ktedonobacterales bacterium]|jgi:hypothetical protein|nr:MAG: hypothetical protein OJF49_003531 [Ktedonobacterales bacterium]